MGNISFLLCFDFCYSAHPSNNFSEQWRKEFVGEIILEQSKKVENKTTFCFPFEIWGETSLKIETLIKSKRRHCGPQNKGKSM